MKRRKGRATQDRGSDSFWRPGKEKDYLCSRYRRGIRQISARWIFTAVATAEWSRIGFANTDLLNLTRIDLTSFLSPGAAAVRRRTKKHKNLLKSVHKRMMVSGPEKRKGVIIWQAVDKEWTVLLTVGQLPVVSLLRQLKTRHWGIGFWRMVFSRGAIMP